MGLPIVGTRTTFSDTTPQVRVITDLISITTPDDTPLIARFGVKNGPPAGWKVKGFPGTQIEWLEDELLPMTDTLAGAALAGDLVLDVNNVGAFHRGDRILVNDEEMWVSGIDTALNQIAVSRGYAGTAAAAHALGDTIQIIGNAQIEADDSVTGSTTAVTNPFNLVQRFADEVSVGDLDREISIYGIDDELEFHVEKKVKENMRKLEQQLYLGGRNLPLNNALPRGMGSLDFYINVVGGNVVPAGGAVVQDDFDQAMQMAYEDGGRPTVALVSPTNKRVIKSWYEAAPPLIIQRSETTVGMDIERVLTPFGTVELLMSRYQPDDRITLIDPEHYSGVVAVTPWTREILARTGWYSRAMLTGVFTHMVRHGATAHAIITDIA